MKYLYILKVGETFPKTKEKFNDFDFWILKVLDKTKHRTKVIDIVKNEKLPNINSAKGFIITGSHDMVTQELPWSTNLEKYVKKISKTKIPLLGICYGHQLIAKALGGVSGFNKRGKEIGVVKIKMLKNHEKDPLLKGFPKKFNAYETHYQTVIKLPYKARVLAKNQKENHQVVRYQDNVWGVQFHPEFDKLIMKEYIINQKQTLEDLNISVDKLLKELKDCYISNTILNNFDNIVK